MAINVVTDDMRAAVHDEDCERLGHDIALDNAIVMVDDRVRPEIGSRDPKQMPHLYCRHCGRVWLVLEDVGSDYAHAETKLLGRLKDKAALRVQSDPATTERRTT